MNSKFESSIQELFASQSKTEELFQALCHPSNGVQYGDHRYNLMKYQYCFLGEELLQWLMRYCRTRGIYHDRSAPTDWINPLIQTAIDRTHTNSSLSQSRSIPHLTNQRRILSNCIPVEESHARTMCVYLLRLGLVVAVWTEEQDEVAIHSSWLYRCQRRYKTCRITEDGSPLTLQAIKRSYRAVNVITKAMMDSKQGSVYHRLLSIIYDVLSIQ